MDQSAQLAGKRVAIGNKELLIRQRKKTSDNKPALYLLDTSAPPRERYFSSLYPVPGSSDFVFEKNGKYFSLDFLSGSAMEIARAQYWRSRS